MEQSTHITRQQRVDSKGSTFTLIIGPQDYKNVFNSDYKCEGPDDERHSAEEVLAAGF